VTKFLIGIAVGVILTVLTAAIVFKSLITMAGERRPSVASNSALILRLEGELPEREPVELPIPFLEQQTPNTILDVWDILRKAAVDSRIKAVVVEPRDLAVGWAKLQELRADLVQFRKSGKPLVAYLRSPGSREYYLASAADKIYVSPEDVLDVKGFRAELMFFKNTLDKLGVEVQVEHAGKYKDFGDMFVRQNMSPETREVLDSILDRVFGNFVTVVAESRKKTPDQIRAAIDEGPFLAAQALKAGLVDGLLYEDQVFGEVERRTGNLQKISHREYAKIPASSLGLEGGAKIVMLVGEGSITRGSSSDDGMSDDGITSTGFNRLLRRVSDDDTIRGVIVRIDSPGGDAIASDEIWRQMNLLSKKKPVVISMSDTAASGGYYMAMTGDPVLAYGETYTGSIGVVFGKPTFKGLYDKLGITKDALTRGKFASVDSDYVPLSEAARQKLREGIDNTYHSFVEKVAAARKKKFEEIAPLAEGRVWLGSQAKERGLVDEIGGINRAIEIVKQKAGIGAGEKVTIVTYPPKRNWFDVIFGRAPEEVLDATVRSKLRGVLGSGQIRLWLNGGIMRVMPYAIDVH
jgi:protease IV